VHPPLGSARSDDRDLVAGDPTGGLLDHFLDRRPPGLFLPAVVFRTIVGYN